MENIEIDTQTFSKDVVVSELPSVSRTCSDRSKIRIACKGLSSCRLEKVSEWKQPLTDNTSRAHKNITSFVIKIKEGGEHDIEALSAHRIGKDSTASGVANIIETMIRNLKKWLDRWGEAIEDSFPKYQYGVPSSNALCLGKLQGKFATSIA